MDGAVARILKTIDCARQRFSAMHQMASSNEVVVSSDLYGTLLPTKSIGQELSEHFG